MGSMLFQRSCSGSKAVSTTDTKAVSGISFKGYGSHHDNYPAPYLTVCTNLSAPSPVILPLTSVHQAAAAIGASRKDAEVFCHRLDKVLASLSKKQSTGGGLVSSEVSA